MRKGSGGEKQIQYRSGVGENGKGRMALNQNRSSQIRRRKMEEGKKSVNWFCLKRKRESPCLGGGRKKSGKPGLIEGECCEKATSRWRQETELGAGKPTTDEKKRFWKGLGRRKSIFVGAGGVTGGGKSGKGVVVGELVGM